MSHVPRRSSSSSRRSRPRPPTRRSPTSSSSSEANLRWAGNSLTTNGADALAPVVVISFVDGGAGMAAGTVARTGTPDIAELVAASEQAARDAGPGRGRRPAGLRRAAGRRRLGRRPGRDLDPGVRGVRPGPRRRRSARPATAASCCSASPSTRCATTYLGTSTGLRLRHDQPTGRVELNGKSPDFSRSVWSGVGTRDFLDVSVAGARRRGRAQAGAGRSGGSSCRPGATRRCCRRRRSAT